MRISDWSSDVCSSYLGSGDHRLPHAGGAAQSNVFTRIALALFGQVPWRAVPEMPVEIMLLPRWFPFHLSKVSYWSRTVIAPLLVVMDRKPRAANPRGVSIRELFRDDPARETYNMSASENGRAAGRERGGK